MIRRSILLGAALFAFISPLAAQENIGGEEIIVTGSRSDFEGFDDRMPAVGLRRTADFAIQPVTVTGDTRDPDARHQEMYETIRRAIEAAGTHGVQLAIGQTIVEPLTPANYRDLTLARDSRPDTNRIALLVKAPLSGNVDAREATARIDRFIKGVKPVGRALLEPNGDMTLSVVAPDQYRADIGRKIAEDAAAMAARFGPDYGVEVRGLHRPVEWGRAGLTEVLLYIPYELTIAPKS